MNADLFDYVLIVWSFSCNSPVRELGESNRSTADDDSVELICTATSEQQCICNEKFEYELCAWILNAIDWNGILLSHSGYTKSRRGLYSMCRLNIYIQNIA